MKRWIFSFLVFPIALSVGVVAIYLTTLREAKVDHCPVSTSLAAVSNEQPSKTGFRAEFDALPNLIDAEYPDWNERFIDPFRFDGILRESEAVARSGQTWLALFERKDKYELVSVTANVKKLKTVSWPGDEPDVRLSFNKPGIPIFALRDFRHVRTGEIQTLYLRPSEVEIDRRGLEFPGMKDGDSKDFYLNEKKYVLRVAKGVALNGDRLSVLVLETGSEKQIIDSHFFEPDSPVGNLLWAGDLDRDGKLDLYFEPFTETGGFGGFLFLSSEAGDGKMVRNVAAFGVAGC